MAPGKLEWKPLTLTPVNFSLTEGTAIPAPLDSPPDSPRPPTPGQGPLSSHPTPKSSSGTAEHKDRKFGDSTAERLDHGGRVSDVTSPMSPTSVTGKRPGSVRKFLGLRSLSSDSLNSDRPGSPGAPNGQQSLSRRKSSGWFGSKKKTYSGGVGSVPEGRENVASPAQPAKPKGPPPPALPELKSFGVNDDALSLKADDMFKKIGADGAKDSVHSVGR